MYNAQSFTHRNQTPLTIQEIARRAPSALATRPYDGTSTKYTHIATLGVIEAMIAAGFQPFSATQSRTRVPAKASSPSTCCVSGTRTFRRRWPWAT